jgi:predicted nucleic acid-binding protein
VGALTLPASGVVYVDTQILIYSVEKHPDYWGLPQPLWAASQTRQIQVATSELALLETLVGPLKSGNMALADTYERLLVSTELRLIPVSATILKEAASLRAQFNLRTPDAIHAASALAVGCTAFVGNDAGFRRVLGIQFQYLTDLLPP